MSQTAVSRVSWVKITRRTLEDFFVSMFVKRPHLNSSELHAVRNSSFFAVLAFEVKSQTKPL